VRIWLTELAEQLPTSPGRRLMRVGMLAERLASAGHDVTWWTSTFDHVAKLQRFPEDSTERVAGNYRIELLHAPGYASNHSLARVRHHRHSAAAFARRAAGAIAPDLVYCCIPTLEVTEAALGYATALGIPTVVDVRDLWPDVYLRAVPAVLRALARVLLAGEYRRARRILGSATAIVAVSEGYLQWGLRHAGRARAPGDRVFPHGYPVERFAPEQLAGARRQLEAVGVDPQRSVCSFVGTFGRTYDLGPVIATARSMLERDDRRAQFVLAGDGEGALEWRTRAAGLSNVVFTGWLSAAGIAALLEMSSVGLGAYAAGAPQGLPNKLYEYLSAGVPILSSLRGESEALLAGAACGRTYAAGDPASFAAALESLLADPEQRRAMGRRALSKFERDFRADAVYAALVRYLEGIVTPRSRETPQSGAPRSPARSG